MSTTGTERQRQLCDVVRVFADPAKAEAAVAVHRRLLCTPIDCPRLRSALQQLTGDQPS
ncbi:hypothetical protein [Nocardia sp. NPDC057030]|uniref:hypothetical protein n=1 Tax=unclassified Nocardia TaxID=2637762 RepID=UPI003636850E